jgi:hypothetical protein
MTQQNLETKDKSDLKQSKAYFSFLFTFLILPFICQMKRRQKGTKNLNYIVSQVKN